jgi:hypothetical protein
VRVASKAFCHATAVAGGRGAFALLVATLALFAAAPHTARAGECKPRHPLPAISLKDMGPCGFDLGAMSFAGDPKQQAMCLLRSLDPTRNLGPPLQSLPEGLASRIGEKTGLPGRDLLSRFLSAQNLEWDFAAYLWQPLSRAHDNDPSAPEARYFVIHDTSGPNYRRHEFPIDVDDDPAINNLARFHCSDSWELAHVIVNREGEMLLGHDFSTPWRATKFERAVQFDGALKGLFVHIELVQPRRSEAALHRSNDAEPPVPAFSAVQYERLALLYIIASVRAGAWLTPAFHAAIDAHIPNGHDDPLNFDLAAFARAIDTVAEQVQSPQRRQAQAP